MANPHISLIIAAGGLSKRFSGGQKKQFTKLNGITILERCINTFSRCVNIQSIVLVTVEDELLQTKALAESLNIRKIDSIITGGSERKFSVYKGFLSLSDETDIVAIHDAARPLVTESLVKKTINYCIEYGACIPAVRITDTIKSVNCDSVIESTISRDKLWRAQTPQVFRYDVLKETYENINLEKEGATDESQLVEKCGFKVRVIEGSSSNIKITTPDDLHYAEYLLNNGMVV